MKAEIEQRLQSLIGQPLSDMWRYAGYQKFEFGIQHPYKNRKGQDITRADWGLVVGGDWRITHLEEMIVSSDDFEGYRSISQIIEVLGSATELPDGDGTRGDQSAGDFYGLLSDTFPLVETIKAQHDGSVRISMTAGYVLEILACGERDGERWRFVHKNDEENHLVITPEGIQ